MPRKLLVAFSVATTLVLSACGNWLGIPKLGQHREIVDRPFSQDCIDDGDVCAWNGAANPHQGRPYLAAHRSTHGSTGLYWPTLNPGDCVYIDDDQGHRHWFTLFSERFVNSSIGLDGAHAGALTLQTSSRSWEPGDAHLSHFGTGC
jgi:hypothetical protein